MIPILFEYNAAEKYSTNPFNSHGIGDLVDAMQCRSKITQDGEYELSFEYPMNGALYSELKINRIVVAKVNDHDNPQGFRIYGFEKNLNGTIKVACQHLSYDLCGIPIYISNGTYNFKDIEHAEDALVRLKTFRDEGDRQPESLTAIDHPFNFHTDIPNTVLPYTDDHKFTVDEAKSARAILLDGDDSIKGAWGGDLTYDNLSVFLSQTAGRDRGVVLEYGVDIVDLSVEENISEMWTGVLAYYKNGESENEVVIYAKDSATQQRVRYASGNFTKHKIMPVDLTDQFPNEAPSEQDLWNRAGDYILAERIGEPEIKVTVSYAKLGQDIRMHDAVTVRFPSMGIDVKAKVTSYTYNVLAERCEEIEISNAKYSNEWKGLEDASRLKRGLLSPKRIAANSINSSHLGGGSVGSKQIADGAISTVRKLATSCIDWLRGQWQSDADTVAKDVVDHDAVREANSKARASYWSLVANLTACNTFEQLKYMATIENQKDK